jgi:chloramphenicol O-acetyltransferase type A
LYEYDTINASSTINKENSTFGFSNLKYRKDFKNFTVIATPEIEKVRKSDRLVSGKSVENVVHFSTLP